MRVEHAGEHRGHQRNQRDAVPGDPFRECFGVESGSEHDATARRQRTRDDRKSADPRDGHAQQPAIVGLPAEVRGACPRRCEQGRPGEYRPACLPAGSRRMDDRRRARVRHAPGARCRRGQAGTLRRGELRVHEQCRDLHLQQSVERDDGLERVVAQKRIGHPLARVARKLDHSRTRQFRELGKRVRPRPDYDACGRGGVLRGGEDREGIAAGRAHRQARGEGRGAHGNRRNLRKSGSRFSR